MPRSTIRSVKAHTITPSVSGDKPHLDRTRGRFASTIWSVEVPATSTDHSVSQVPEQATAATRSRWPLRSASGRRRGNAVVRRPVLLSSLGQLVSRCRSHAETVSRRRWRRAPVRASAHLSVPLGGRPRGRRCPCRQWPPSGATDMTMLSSTWRDRSSAACSTHSTLRATRRGDRLVPQPAGPGAQLEPALRQQIGVAASLAKSSGCRKSLSSTRLPTRRDRVAPAAAVSATRGASCSPNGSGTKWSRGNRVE
jgi:hypothetical protein